MTEPPIRPDLPQPTEATRKRPRARVLWGATAAVCIVVTTLIVLQPSAPTPQLLPPTGGSLTQDQICQKTDDLLASAEAAPDSGWDVPSDLADQLPTDYGAGLIDPFEHPIPQASVLAEGRPDADEWIDQLTSNGFEQGLERWWAATYGVAGAQVLRFGSHADALRFQHWIIHGSCVNATRVFAVDGVSGSIGLRLIWSGSDVSEQVSFVRGPYRYLASIRTGQAPPRWWVVDETIRLGSGLGIPISRASTPCTVVRSRLADVGRHSPVNAEDPDDLVTTLPPDLGAQMDPLVAGSPTTTRSNDPVFRGLHPNVEDAWRKRLRKASFRDSARRDWTLSDGTVHIVIDAFDTHRDALDYQEWLTENVTCTLAIDTFVPTRIAGIGLQVPGANGTVADDISFVIGRLHVDVVSIAAGQLDHLRVEALAQGVLDHVS
jgi:hypothetical protein